MPATAAQLDTLAARLAHEEAWKGALAISGRTAFADRAEALADLYRSVGIEALVIGFEAAKDAPHRAAARRRAGSGSTARAATDLAAGRIDVRVIVLLGYLVERHGSVTVSSLFSGHRKFARPGVVSAHIVRARGRHRRRRRHRDRGQPAARRHHRGSRSLGAAPPRRAPAAAGDLAARTGRAVVPASRPRRPHPRWLLGQRGFSARTGASSASTCSWRRARFGGCAACSAAAACARAKGSCFARPARSTRSSCASRSTPSSSTAISSCVGIEPSLGPWRTAGRRGAKSVVELASGECERRGIEVGDTLTLAP